VQHVGGKINGRVLTLAMHWSSASQWLDRGRLREYLRAYRRLFH
jgi:hypothetical protein